MFFMLLLFLGWTADDIATMENQEEVHEILSKYGRGQVTNGNTDTGGVKKVRGGVIPPPSMYGGPALDDGGMCNLTHKEKYTGFFYALKKTFSVILV
jgi:hypothetical protein